MTPQKVVIKIPRKQSELIPFDIDKWNTGEYEAIHEIRGIGRVLCTDNKGDCPIVVAYEDGGIITYTIDGKYNAANKEPYLFLRKKSSEELPKDDFINVYPNGIGTHSTLIAANKNATNNRLAIIHITYQWEDEK